MADQNPKDHRPWEETEYPWDVCKGHGTVNPLTAPDWFPVRRVREAAMQSDQPQTTLTETQVFRAAELLRVRAGLMRFLERCEAVRADVPFELAVLHSCGDIIGTTAPIPRAWINEAIVAMSNKAQSELNEMGVLDA